MTEAYRLRLGDLESISFSDLLLKPGKIVELLIDGHWIKGHVERWNQVFYWFSEKNNVAVVLHPGLEVKIA